MKRAETKKCFACEQTRKCLLLRYSDGTEKWVCEPCLKAGWVKEPQDPDVEVSSPKLGAYASYNFNTDAISFNSRAVKETDVEIILMHEYLHYLLLRLEGPWAMYLMDAVAPTVRATEELFLG